MNFNKTRPDSTSFLVAVNASELWHAASGKIEQARYRIEGDMTTLMLSKGSLGRAVRRFARLLLGLRRAAPAN
jgi:hypothetical protein